MYKTLEPNYFQSKHIPKLNLSQWENSKFFFFLQESCKDIYLMNNKAKVDLK